jgi:hypothetical protein
VAGSCEHDEETSVSGATELVCFVSYMFIGVLFSRRKRVLISLWLILKFCDGPCKTVA